MISKKVFDFCLKNGLTIGFAESITGGALSHALAQYPGASHILKGSIIAYQPEAKETLLFVKPKTIGSHTLVSAEVAFEMVSGLKRQLNPDIAVAITGNAGPTLEPNTSATEAYIAIDYCQHTYQYRFPLTQGDRNLNIQSAVDQTYQYIAQILQV
ncbi:MAG: CinA family protein [Acholeplasmataceae bacterium]|nr:CinA family protein [Acholeplasmataceae bacterium]